MIKKKGNLQKTFFQIWKYIENKNIQIYLKIYYKPKRNIENAKKKKYKFIENIF